MAADEDGTATPPTRLMNFVSEEQLAEARRTRGSRVEDGTAQRDRSLYEILKENKDKQDAEFNERFKHRPPKALDEDETEFLDKLEMSRREYERQMADEEAQQLRSFQAAVAAQSAVLHDLKEEPPIPKVQEDKLVGRKNTATRPSGVNIIVRPQTKKAKTDMGSREDASAAEKSPHVGSTQKPLDVEKTHDGGDGQYHIVANTGLVSYSDESDDD
ncbi:uncharacterized protein LOC127797203 [Diospyros lotus]|uniref:uncharacterized protein LOC127797203 n=1 Tax=Diospyros lotus TaxID=55363 RepID=UPI0022500693|nr:uncharacterized protein LOC127797203 [Diospyros lotus]